jgi:GAF domain-containing protein
MLGNAFNSMTGQLRALIAQLEDRVKARTQEIEKQNQALTHRAAQLQTVSDVARQIVSAQELETLLSSITRLISERFGFYHVGMFLLDEKKENAILRAANSEGGQRMLARHHSLPVGRLGMVGFTTGTGQARIATDVGEDAVFFNNPDLPDTRSEMALPLKVGDLVIGAIDIQSTQSNAFKEDDIELFNTLADQVAIAIYNNQLYIQTLRALDEAQNLHRQYLRSEWAQDAAQRRVLGYVFNQSGVTVQHVENPLWKKVFASGDPLYAVLPSSNGTPDKAVMAVPITIRGETIGVIHVQDQGENRLWSEDEIAVVNSIANQVAVALENARLFENTVRRAEREKKVLQITAKIRSTNDPEEMMRIAVSELQQALKASRTQIYVRQEETEDE